MVPILQIAAVAVALVSCFGAFGVYDDARLLRLPEGMSIALALGVLFSGLIVTAILAALAAILSRLDERDPFTRRDFR